MVRLRVCEVRKIWKILCNYLPRRGLEANWLRSAKWPLPNVAQAFSLWWARVPRASAQPENVAQAFSLWARVPRGSAQPENVAQAFSLWARVPRGSAQPENVAQAFSLWARVPASSGAAE
jgi:hypothetical protein